MQCWSSSRESSNLPFTSEMWLITNVTLVTRYICKINDNIHYVHTVCHQYHPAGKGKAEDLGWMTHISSFCHDDEVMLRKCFQSMPSVVLSSKNVNDKIR